MSRPLPDPSRAYKLVRPDIEAVCRQFCRKYRGADYDECLSMCHGWFFDVLAQWSPTGGNDVGKFFRVRMRLRLADAARAERRRARLLARTGERVDEDGVAAPEAVRPFSPKRFVHGLPPKTKESVREVLGLLFGEDGLLALPSPAKCRAALVRILREDERWTRRRVEETFARIREILNS